MNLIKTSQVFFVCASILCVTLLIVLIRRKGLKDFRKKVLCCLLSLVLFTSLVGIPETEYLSDPSTVPNLSARYALLSIFLLSHSSIPCLFNNYIWLVTGQPYRKWNRKNFPLWILWILPVFVSDLLVILNTFLTPVFSLAEDGSMVYHWGYYVVLGQSLFYGIMAGIYLIKFHKSLRKGEFATLFSFLLITALINIIQIFFVKGLQFDVFGLSILSTGVLFVSEDRDGEKDIITGLNNRAYFLGETRSALNAKAHFRVIVLKITNFDNITHMLSQSMCDELEKELALRLQALKYPKLSFFHYGQEIYIINSYETNREKDNQNLLKEIKEIFAKDFLLGKTSISLNLEMIYLHVPSKVSTLDSIVSIIQAKPTSPYLRYTFLKDEILSTALRTSQVAIALSRALKNHSFEVYYQPIYDAYEGKITTAEALVRLTDSELGPIGPSEFIPVAEETGDIIKIGQIVFDQVCKDMNEYHLLSYGLDHISVNLSKRQFLEEGLTRHFLSSMKENNIQSGNIILEITESLVNNMDASFKEGLKELKDSGFLFSMDDYGTGYSNFSALTGPFGFSIVKLDKSLLWGADKSPTGEILLENNMALVKKLNFLPLCEGVETENQKNKLIQLGCRYLQGYHFSKPVPITQFVSYIDKFNRQSTALGY